MRGAPASAGLAPARGLSRHSPVRARLLATPNKDRFSKQVFGLQRSGAGKTGKGPRESESIEAPSGGHTPTGPARSPNHSAAMKAFTHTFHAPMPPAM